MKVIDLQAKLKLFARSGNSVLSKKQLAGLMPSESPELVNDTITRAIKARVLERVCRGAYAYVDVFSTAPNKLESIARALRVGQYSYVSLESALSEYGVMSQIPLNRVTIMTTGRKTTYKTPYGIIEFTATKKTLQKILEGAVMIQGRPLRLAKLETALEDLKKVGRNLGMIDESIVKELLNESQ